MNITIKGRIAYQLRGDLKKIDVEVFRDIDDDNKHRDVEVELHTLTKNEVRQFHEVLARGAVPGTKVLAADVKKYMRAAEDGVETVAARTVRQAAWMLEQYFAGLDHHLVFSEDDYEGGSFVGYFVDDVKYIPEGRRDNEREHVEVHFVHVEDDRRQASSVSLFHGDVFNMGPIEILKEAGYVPESPTLMATLKAETELFYSVKDEIGKKYTARGYAMADLDDACASTRWSSNEKIRMDNFGLQTPVVVDVLCEKDSERNSRDSSDAHVNMYRWHQWNMRYFSPKEDDLVKHLEADEDSDFQPELQIPVHPLVPCFDLKRHLRLRVHVNNLATYKYRREVADGLVLPERDKRLINMLVDQSHNTFQDVVEGKGASMNVLSGGPAGTGKTLSAEVFAEFKERPLYNVQCSQLGLNPAEIEKNLSVILQRANRWNAVLLLDEADVYIRARGDNLTHNAIVGVFLRMLEYASCILFMTTNLPDNVDDAIASRCVVALHYNLPDAEQQAQIWKNLARLNKLKLADKDIAAFVERHPRVSGRDVKNLLKLASFIAQADGKPIDLAALEYALQYKPTADVAEESEMEAMTASRLAAWKRR